MNQSFILHIDNDTDTDIPFEEIMFVTAVKTNRLKQFCEEIFIVQIGLSDAGDQHTDKLRVVVKVQAQNGEFSGYSYGDKWESALTNGFESIAQQLRLPVRFPVKQNTN
jgi:hypothetical protein